jgi:hypothetical protein
MFFNDKRVTALSKWFSMFFITVGTFFTVIVAIIWNGLHKKDTHAKHNDWFSEW